MDTPETTGPRTEPMRLSVAPPLEQPRDLDDERTITSLAVGAGYPLTLVAMAEDRAHDHGAVRDFTGRDFCEETLEELADARNYLVWQIQQLEARGPAAATSPARRALDRALSHVARSFDLVHAAKRDLAQEPAA